MVLNLFRPAAVLPIVGLAALSATSGVAHKDHNNMVEAEEAAHARAGAEDLLVQGWRGSALVHGMDHMNF